MSRVYVKIETLTHSLSLFMENHFEKFSQKIPEVLSKNGKYWSSKYDRYFNGKLKYCLIIEKVIIKF